MKKFNHVGPASELQELKTQNVDGQRFYQAPSGKWLPSVTTVVGKQSIDGIRTVSYTHLTLPTNREV